jgi:hypothetical protein
MGSGTGGIQQAMCRGDWGDVCQKDRRTNDQALIDGSRILSAHRTSLGAKLWIMTEAAVDVRQRTATILLPSVD